MNGIEPLLVALLVYAARDGLLAWWLIHKLIGPGSASVPIRPAAPASIPEPLPGPVAPVPIPSVPTPATPASAVRPRFTGITATSFAGGNDSAISRTSAYDGKIINGDTELAVALPSRITAGRLVRAFYKGRTVDAPIRDVGPWNTHDAYWENNSRPQAEAGTDTTGRKTNFAGIDLSPAAWAALGYVGNPREAKDKIDWDFADILDGKASSTPTAGTVPAQLVLMRKLRDMGIHAEHDSAIILSWPVAISNKFPEMADYCKGYVHDTTPWCGLTMAYVMAMSGIRPQFGQTDTDRFLWADSWRQFGTAVETPQPGDVLVFKWAGGGHHVTLYDHEISGDYYSCTGGNQGSGHVLSTENMPMQNCVAIRRPS